jgi:hypothetical protein
VNADAAARPKVPRSVSFALLGDACGRSAEAKVLLPHFSSAREQETSFSEEKEAKRLLFLVLFHS